MQNRADDEEVVLNEDGEELELESEELSREVLAQKLTAVRKELAAAQKESREHLDGWQRTKADLVNVRRMADAEVARALIQGSGRLAREILPALDSFAAAMQAPEWSEVAENWRTGVERIEGQLSGALSRAGLVSYGSVGERFDPAVHECMSVQVTEDEALDDTVAEVLQKGYRLNDEVIRPAKVIVAQYRAGSADK